LGVGGRERWRWKKCESLGKSGGDSELTNGGDEGRREKEDKGVEGNTRVRKLRERMTGRGGGGDAWGGGGEKLCLRLERDENSAVLI